MAASTDALVARPVGPRAHHGAIRTEPDDILICKTARGSRASRTTYTLRRARLTTSFETATLRHATRARLTRRVFVPDR